MYPPLPLPIMYRFLILCLIMGVGTAFGQSVQTISLSLNHESIAFPFTRFVPVHPGVEIGLTLKEVEKPSSIRNLNINAGFYHHRRLENGLYVRGEYAFRPRVKSFMTIDLLGNLGYLYSFYPGELYEQDPQSGEFEKLPQIGRSHFIGSMGVGATLLSGKKIQPFFRQELVVVTPFANGIPLILHSFFKIGINIQL